MELSEIEGVIARIRGCTFASIDAETMPYPGIRRVSLNESVLLFNNKQSSGYENMVKRRLEEIGKDPEGFTVGPLPWGARIEGTPFILHKGKHYLQTILVRENDVLAYIGSHPIDPESMPLLRRRPANKQGLPEELQVIVQTYMISSIAAIRLMGEEIKTKKRDKLRLIIK